MPNTTGNNLGRYKGTINGPYGNKYWIKKSESAPIPTEPLPPSSANNILTGLYAAWIISDIPKVSIKIFNGTYDLASFILMDISSWTLNYDSITLYSGDPVPINLQFINSTEASIAEDRLTQALNGTTLI